MWPRGCFASPGIEVATVTEGRGGTFVEESNGRRGGEELLDGHGLGEGA
jgi:hypothetical protein